MTDQPVSWRWVRRWPYLTAILIGVVLMFVASVVLATLIPAITPVSGMVGLVVGVTAGTRVAGLEGTRQWVIVAVPTAAIGLILAGVILEVS